MEPKITLRGNIHAASLQTLAHGRTFLIGLFVSLAMPAAHAQFTFTNLGALPGSGPTPVVTAFGLNATGDVCGSASFVDPVTAVDPIHAYHWKPTKANATLGAMTDL